MATVWYNDGSIYSGMLADSARNGFGSYNSSMGPVYLGLFKNNWEHFNGTLTLTDGSFNVIRKGNVFIPTTGGTMFVDAKGIIEGNGTIHLPNGSMINGVIQDGLLMAQGSLNITTDIMSGDTIDLTWTGYGRMNYFGRVYTGQFRNGHFHGNGTVVYPPSGTGGARAFKKYTGEFAGGQQHGHGRLETTAEGEYIEGDFKHGEPNGNVTWIKVNGQNFNYTGEIKDWDFNGKGTLLGQEGVYNGQFLDGEFDGQGTFTSSDDTVYHGGFKHDTIDGNGTLTLADGSFYSGQFSNSDWNGYGTYFDSSTGQVYWGEFENGWKRFNGTLTLSDGRNYTGVRKGDIFIANDVGILVTSSGDIIEFEGIILDSVDNVIVVDGHTILVGDFEEDAYGSTVKGNGTVYFPNGKVYTGTLKQGKWEGPGEVNFTSELNNSTKCHGKFIFRNGVRHGPARVECDEGSWFVGNYVNDTQHGIVRNSFSDGVYEGPIVNDKRDGPGGVLTYANGTSYVGEYKEGLPIGIHNRTDPVSGVQDQVTAVRIDEAGWAWQENEK